MDDLGYVRKSEAETYVLFELIAHRYESGSMIITTNQPFGDWDQIFSDTTMTVAAIDRLVHHGIIIEIQADSFRKKEAMEHNKRIFPASISKDDKEGQQGISRAGWSYQVSLPRHDQPFSLALTALA